MKMNSTKTKQDYAQRMDKVCEYIQRNSERHISLDDLAQEANFSKYHFHRIFTGMVGETVKSYLRRVRLEHAASKLCLTKDPLLRIALEGGFESHATFTRAFRKQFGQTPSSYRKNNSWKKREQRMTYWKNISLEVTLVERPAMNVACVRHVGHYRECGKAWEKLCSWAGPLGLLQPDMQRIGVCYSDPDITPADKIMYDACLEITQPVQGNDVVTIKTLEGGSYAQAIHCGPYDTVSETYSQLCGQWLPQHGYRIASEPSFEVYLNAPGTTAPEDLRTEIHVPLASA